MAKPYFVRLTQTGLSQPIVNVFFYIATPDTEAVATAFLMAEAFEPLVPDAINTLQITTVTNSELYVYNLLDPTDLEVRGLSGGGDTAGTVNTQIDAIGFRSNRTRRDIRRGFKRIGGIPDSAVVDQALNTAFNTAAGTLAGLFGDQLLTTAPNPNSAYDPIVIKRIFTGITGGKRQYRLPETEGELEYFIASQWQHSSNIRSQATRRPDPVWI
jgi:hypothetical protein